MIKSFAEILKDLRVVLNSGIFSVTFSVEELEVVVVVEIGTGLNWLMGKAVVDACTVFPKPGAEVPKADTEVPNIDPNPPVAMPLRRQSQQINPSKSNYSHPVAQLRHSISF